MNQSLKQILTTSKKRIAVWGIGYIGYSSMAHFAREGVYCIGGDISQKNVDDININGKSNIPNIEYWLNFDVKPLTEKGLISATTNLDDLISDKILVHLIAVPTEKDGLPNVQALKQVLSRIFKKIKTNQFKNIPLIIIESTISLDTIDNLIIPLANSFHVSIGEEVRIGVAPRRDWFVSPDKTLKSLPRIIGGFDQYTTDLMADVLSIVCDHLLKAKDARHACLVKSVENAYRQLDITFANQLSLAYPDINIIEVLKLAGTKWNVQTYHPSFGSGGYCIPLAPLYIIKGATKPKELSLLEMSIESNDQQPKRIANSLINRNAKCVGILGLAYTEDIKVDILSPTIAISRELLNNNIAVKINDPLYTSTEIYNICMTDTFKFPAINKQFDTILIVSPHSLYKSTPFNKIISSFPNCRLIIDNMGAWRDKRTMFKAAKIEYHEAGDEGWL